MNDHPVIAVSLLLALVAASNSCGGGSSGPVSQPPPPVSLETGVQRVFNQLTFNLPVALMQAPSDISRWFVVEQ